MFCRVKPTLAAIVAILVLSGSLPQSVTPQTAASEGSLSIMVVGDSISLGCDSVPLGGWCSQLSSLLAERGISHTIAGHVISGWSCGSLSAGFASRFDQIQPDVVIMNCGTNDAPQNQTQKDSMGTAWRIMVEYAYTHGALILPVFIQYSNVEINNENGRWWLVPGERNANDTIYVNHLYYVNAGWFVGLADFQQIPGTWDYLNGGTDGIHPNLLGQSVYATIVYRAMQTHYGWPATVQARCGMWGHSVEYNAPDFTPCVSMT